MQWIWRFFRLPLLQWCKHLLSCLFPHTKYTNTQYKRKLSPHPAICHRCQWFSSHFYTHKNCSSPLQGLLICYRYNKENKKLLYKLKYNHRYGLAAEIAQHMYPHIDSHPLWTYLRKHPHSSIICPVPSHRIRKYIIKWYNQSEKLARHIADHYGVPYLECCRRTKGIGSQVWRSKAHRRTRLQNAFILRKTARNKTILSSCKVLILIDDITTTGATLTHLARVIHSHFPHIHIRGCVFAKKQS